MSLLDPLEKAIYFAIDGAEVAHAAVDRWRDARIRSALVADIAHDLLVVGISPASIDRYLARLTGEDMHELFIAAAAARDLAATGSRVPGRKEAA